MNYDVIIIGAGPSGIFCAYELKKQNKNLKVLIIEKGRSIEKRMCPKRKTLKCVNCNPCSITTGFAGAGFFLSVKCHLPVRGDCRSGIGREISPAEDPGGGHPLRRPGSGASGLVCLP